MPKPAQKKAQPPQSSWGCAFDDDKYDAWLSRIEYKLDKLLKLQTQEGKLLMSVQDDINAAVAAVAQNTTVVGSVQTLLTQLTTLITNLKGQITDPAAVAALESAVAALQANNAALAAAVTANTPAS